MRFLVTGKKHVGLLLLLLLLVVSACGDSDEEQSADNPENAKSEVVTVSNPSSAPAQNQAAMSAQEGYPNQQVLAQLYDQILPSVVDIVVTASTSQAQGVPLPFGPQQPPGPMRGEGSGWVYDDQGHIVTNNHVVEGADAITVNFADGSWATGEVVATDPQADLAVIRVTPPAGLELRPLPLATLDAVDVGYWVLAFGTPFGLEGTMTLGIVSAQGRGFPMASENGGAVYTLPDVIQTDAAINPGNSGGPLVNLNGEVVGVNFAINTTSGTNSGVGFAIPSNVVKRIVPALIEKGGYAYPYLGISGGSVTPQMVEEQVVPANVFGIWISGVVEGGPAAEAGLQPGDVITALDGQPVRSFDGLVSYLLNNTTPGQEVTVTFIRNGEEQSASLTIQERPSEQPIVSQDESGAAVAIGQAIEIARQTVLNAGLMQSVESTSATLQGGGGRSVWIVTLTGDGKTATVSVDATTGNVLGLNIE